MNRKGFDGKAIYNPQGKAGEYSEWACNFFTGCSNDCEYCYCKRGFMSHVWSDKPKLKKCFKDETDALIVFEKELMANIKALRESSLFFTFTSDPFLNDPGVSSIHTTAMLLAMENGVRVQALTKRAEFAYSTTYQHLFGRHKDMVAFGFTLTGHDDLEPHASTNRERIEAMKALHDGGYRTFASIEPVVDFESSMRMIQNTIGHCDLYKIGLMSGKGMSAIFGIALDPLSPPFQEPNRNLLNTHCVTPQELYKAIDSNLVCLGISLMPCLLQTLDVLPGIFHYIQIPTFLCRLFYVGHNLIHAHALDASTQEVAFGTVRLNKIVCQINVLLIL